MSAGLGAALGAALLWLVFRDANSTALLDALRNCDPVYLLAALAAGLLAVVAKAARWVVLLRGTAALPIRASLAAVFVGSAGNALLSHLGELPRILMAARETGAGVAGLLASIVAERIFDLCALAALMVLVLALVDQAAATTAQVEQILGAAGLATCVLVLAALLLGDSVARRLESGSASDRSSWRSKLAILLRQVLAAFQVFRSRSDLALALVLSFAMWILYAACILGSLLATGTDASFGDALRVLGVNAVALILPAPPGRVGTIEASFAIARVGTSLDETRVLAASIVYNALMTIPYWCIGGWIWWRRRR